MPITLAQLTTNRAEVDIRIGDGALHVVYRPQKMTPRAVRVITQFQTQMVRGVSTSGDNLASMKALDDFTEWLGSLLLDWDLEYPDADGQPSGHKIPPTVEGLADVDYELQLAIIQGIYGDMRLGELRGTASSARSVATSSRARATGSRGKRR